MRSERDEGGRIRLAGLDLVVADTILRIPRLLRCEDPEVRERLFPPACDDEEEERQWRRLAGTELEHLYLSQGEVVRKDLANLTQAGEGEFALPLPEEHRAAWLAALNAARLTLYILHDLRPGDMEAGDIAEVEPEKEMALVRIHIMAYLQELLIQA